MQSLRSIKGFSLIEVSVGVAVFLIFSVGIFSALSSIFKMVYQSRLRILQTAVATEQLEVVRNLPFSSVGTVGGTPSGVIPQVQTIVRSGVTFAITTTIRNVDDPFDGTATSTPVDTAPADFKFIQVWVQCVGCDQQKPVVMSTQLAPKALETETDNGSLFVLVINANGSPVSGATVRVRNPSSTPAIDLTDVTDSDGWLRVVDTPTGTLAYHVTVGKTGYSSDYTISPTATNTSPTKLPASVTSQNVTTLYFSIDQTGSVDLQTMSPVCEALGSVPMAIRGDKKIGSLPVVYKYNRVLTSNGSGEYSLTNVEWDTYSLSATGTTYDLAGTIPMSPFTFLPGASQVVSFIVSPHTTRSLLVKVKDSGTGLPLSGATVRLTATGYDRTLYTGLGYIQQTDWSGGSGQADFSSSDQYFSDDSRVSTTAEPGDVVLKQFGGNYLSDGFLESSTFDLGVASNFSNITSNPTAQPTSTGSNTVLLQIATSNSSSPATWNFLGPDGTANTYYSPTNTTINALHNDNRYVRYRAYLQTADTSVSPRLSDVSITYTTSCLAPGQSFFNSLSAATYTLEVSHDGYGTNSGTIVISGNQETQVNLSPL